MGEVCAFGWRLFVRAIQLVEISLPIQGGVVHDHRDVVSTAIDIGLEDNVGTQRLEVFIGQQRKVGTLSLAGTVGDVKGPGLQEQIAILIRRVQGEVDEGISVLGDGYAVWIARRIGRTEITMIGSRQIKTGAIVPVSGGLIVDGKGNTVVALGQLHLKGDTLVSTAKGNT